MRKSILFYNKQAETIAKRLQKFEPIDGEEWKKINGFDFAKISNYGRVMGKYGLLKPQTDKYGYLSVCICDGKRIKRFFIHRLVMIHFGDKQPADKKYVNHKDLNKQNNHISNLEWVSPSENSKHYEKNRSNSKYNSEICFDENGKKFNSYREAGRFYNISANTVKNDVTGKTKKSLKNRMTFHK